VHNKKKGLPLTITSRHGSHYVEELLLKKGGAIGKSIKIDQLEPNPYQPRKDYGDLEELAKSIKGIGIIEPLIVRPLEENKYQIICGERRYRAALLAGLKEVPCIEKEIDEREMLEIALIENLCRKDLDAFEEAEALKRLSEEFKYTHNKIAEITGKSRSYITEIISLNNMPEDLKTFCRHADIKAKSLLVEIVRTGSPEKMWDLAKKIAKREIKREDIRQEKRSPNHKKKVKYFKYVDPQGDYSLSIKFFNGIKDKDTIIKALNAVIDFIKKSL